jgi:hypothetical protein
VRREQLLSRPGLCAALVAGDVLGLLLAPEAADAQIGLPFLRDLPAPAVPSISDLVRSAVDALFELLFGDIPKRITGEVLHWLLTHPEFGEATRFDTLDRGAGKVREVAYGLAVAFFCAGLARHLFDDATSGGIEATRRFVFAVAGITIWPWAFTLAVRFSNLATEAFLEVPELSRTTVALLSFAFIGGAAVGIGFLCGLIAAVLLIALFLEKVLVLTGLTVLYVLMPVLMAASPFPPTSHLLGVGSAALTAMLVLNPLWTALLAIFALVGEGALLVGAVAVEDFIEPLLAIAMLVLVVGSLPLLLRMAWARGVAAALMTPPAGAHHGGGSSLASMAAGAHGARSVRAVLEQRSSDRLQQSAWHVEDFAVGAGSAAAALPILSDNTSGGALPTGSDAGQHGFDGITTHGTEERPKAGSREQESPGSTSHGSHNPMSRDTVGSDSGDYRMRRAAPEPSPLGAQPPPAALSEPDQLRLPFDDERRDT